MNIIVVLIIVTVLSWLGTVTYSYILRSLLHLHMCAHYYSSY